MHEKHGERRSVNASSWIEIPPHSDFSEQRVGCASDPGMNAVSQSILSTPIANGLRDGSRALVRGPKP